MLRSGHTRLVPRYRGDSHHTVKRKVRWGRRTAGTAGSAATPASAIVCRLPPDRDRGGVVAAPPACPPRQPPSPSSLSCAPRGPQCDDTLLVAPPAAASSKARFAGGKRPQRHRACWRQSGVAHGVSGRHPPLARPPSRPRRRAAASRRRLRRGRECLKGREWAGAGGGGGAAQQPRLGARLDDGGAGGGTRRGTALTGVVCVVGAWWPRGVDCRLRRGDIRGREGRRQWGWRRVPTDEPTGGAAAAEPPRCCARSSRRPVRPNVAARPSHPLWPPFLLPPPFPPSPRPGLRLTSAFPEAALPPPVRSRHPAAASRHSLATPHCRHL